ncbi:MAG TPA: GxxExxY protein [Pyrinomonadaceae bacterium]|nr:GxxExxY protein [Pyrinomonadaceae bacterium]
METVPHDGNIFTLSDVIRETSYEIHKYLRSGFTEKIYENALAHRLRKRGIRVEQQQCVRVFDEDGTLLGLLRTDILIERILICEIKSCGALLDAHTAQLLGYLRATKIQHGLLINFGGPKLDIRKYILT